MKNVFAILAGALLLFLSIRSPSQSREPPNQGKKNTDGVMQNDCEKLLKDHRRIYYLNSRHFRMSMQIRGIYTQGEMVFFRMHFNNHANINYDVDSIRFFIKDAYPQKKGKQGVVELSPVYTYGNVRLIHGKSQEDAVMVFPRFTLQPGKRLSVEVSEKNGGRRLEVLADNFTLVRARLI
jgi:hypothetical protein